MSGRACDWCHVPLEPGDYGPRAQYCCRSHAQSASPRRSARRNTGFEGDRPKRQPLTGAQRDTAWMDDAACSGTGTKPFFPDDTTGIHRDQIEATKAVCDGCKVEETCLTYALVHRIEHGIWGGTTEVERRRLVGAL